MATWPTGFPKVLAAGYKVEPGEQTIRTQMDAGPARVRRFTESPNPSVSASVILSDAQLAEFKQWFNTDLLGGSGWFTGLGLDIANVGLQDDLELRFIGTPAYAHIAALKFRIDMQLEVRDA